MYQAPLPSATTGCRCPAGHQAMTLIERLLWNPLYPYSCKVCGQTLRRPRAMFFLGVVPIGLMLFMFITTMFWPGLADRFFDAVPFSVLPFFLMQLIAAALEYRYSPIVIRPPKRS